MSEPSAPSKQPLRLSDVGGTEQVEGWCVYCQQITTWLVTVLTDNRLRFECTRCCKISRDVTVA